MSIVAAGSAVSQSHTLGFADQTEEVRVDALPVAGEVPTWLRGGLVRVTPAQMDFEKRSVTHWFDGMAMLNRFGFAGDGTVSYASRFLDTKARREALASGGASIAGFATDPCRSLFQRVQSVFNPALTDNANVNLSRVGDEYIAMTETPIPVRFDPETLATLGHDEGVARFGQITTAHPHHGVGSDGVAELINFAAHLGRKSVYKIYARRSASEARTLATLPVREPSYMHSFALTERHVVLIENPLVVNPIKLALGAKSFIHNYVWKPELGTRIHAFDRATGALVRTWTAEPFFVFHTINAYDDGDRLVLDLCAYEDASIIDLLELDRLRAGAAEPGLDARPRRLTLAPNGSVDTRPLADVDLELPRINYRTRNAKPYRYVYGGSSGGAPFLKRLVKIDVADGSHRVWDEPHAWAGEPVFVPRVDATEEDDGVVLSVVLDALAGTSFLLVLDAHTFTEIARAEAPHHVPFGFHGQFFSA
ncbi:MAG TPA: carotenoid oxygenase family protein [Baekduia sp.]|uniref:carotenoid oxygenase family protein n=1 Tax=Baekduia sp. TaxID=2600305 RepID=UPI002D777402|nr:carotenoid oxygenase family protein [Baekduia sp.]HET6506828.1 carotenoid oxygenase family protein [Baekduia sp.]